MPDWTPEQIDAAARVIYRDQQNVDAYRTSVHRDAWRDVARRALDAAHAAQ